MEPKKISLLDAESVKALRVHNSPADITYAELMTLIGTNALIPGAKYRITDYQTTHYMLDGTDVIETAINIAPVEALVVTASSVNTLEPVAYSEAYPQDILHYDPNPENWKYDLAFGAWNEAVLPGWKGAIYFRHDTLNDNYMGYDFRKVKFRRWKLDVLPNGFWNIYAGLSSTSTGVSDPLDFEDYLTFHFTEEVYNRQVMSNHFEPWRQNTQEGMYSILANNVFFPVTLASYNDPEDYGWYQVYINEFAAGCYNNTFGGYVDSSKVGTWFNDNTIGNTFSFNTIGNGFYDNTIGNNFSFNTIGNSFYSNIIGYSFYYNTIGNSFQYNTTGNSFGSNTIANTFRGNTIGNNFGYNTIGNNFGYNTIGNTIGFNTIGNNVQYLIVPDKTILTGFILNQIQDGVGGIESTPLDFTLATHVFEPYNTEIFIRPDGQVRLKYYDNTDQQIIVDPTT